MYANSRNGRNSIPLGFRTGKNCRSVVGALIIALMSGSLPCYAGQPDSEADSWPNSLQEIGYAPFVAPTTQRLDQLPVPTPRDVVKSVSVSMARGESTSVQLAIYGVSGATEKIRIEIVTDLEVEVHQVVPTAIYPDIFEGKWGQPGYWAPFSTLKHADHLPSVGEGGKQAFWLTFHIGSETDSGLHEGVIRLIPANRQATEIQLKVVVQPFVLPVARAAFGVYFNRDLLPNYSHRSPQWLEAIYRDMARHAQNSVTFYEAGNFSVVPPDSTMFRDMMPLAKKVGLIHEHVPCLYLQGNLTGLSVEQQQAAIEWRRQQREVHGWPELIEYGLDEPAYPNPGLTNTYTAFRNVQVRLTTAMSIFAAYGFGDLHDAWIIYGGQITPETCAEARRLGAEPWTYSCHMLSGRGPAPHRYYSGLYTWAYRLGGNWQWAYHWFVWWDETDKVPRSSTEWENRRDGINDYRYLQLCEACVTAQPEHPAAKQARQWLEGLRSRVIESYPDPHLVREGEPLAFADYTNIRETAVGFIREISAETGVTGATPAPKRLKDEAAPYRERSLESCIEALQDTDMENRRSAATALRERGAVSAPATEMLAGLLSDTRTCIPAARALQAIGPSAAASISALEQMTKHRDGFVRLAAVYALAEVGTPTRDKDKEDSGSDNNVVSTKQVVDILRRTLLDDYHPVAKVSGDALIRFGSAAAAALPEAKKLHKIRKYELYAWPYTDFPQEIIQAISAGSVNAKK